MKAKYTLPFLPFILLVSISCFFGTETRLSDIVESPTGYHREVRIEPRNPFGERPLQFYRFERNKISRYCSLTVFNEQRPEENGLYIDQNCDGRVDVYVGEQNDQLKLRDETFENNHDIIYKAKLEILEEQQTS